MLTTLLAAALSTAPTAAPQVPAPDVRTAVKKGLKWLADQQAKDGTWEGRMGYLRVTVTAYAGLAMLMEGSTLREGDYAENLRRAVAWFETNAQENGLLPPANDPFEQGRYMYGHAAALLFLASAYDVDDDPVRRGRLRAVLKKAVAFTAEAASKRGGWGFVAAREGTVTDDTQATTQILHALLATERAGIKVPRDTIDKATAYLTEATNSDGGLVYSPFNGVNRGRSNGLIFPTALAAAALLPADRRTPHLSEWVSFSSAIGRSVPPVTPQLRPGQTSSQTLQQFLALARVANTLGETGHLRLKPGTPEADLMRWSAVRAPLYHYLKATQQPGGDWADPSVSPAYGTALALLILQLDNNYLPAFSR